MIAYKDLSDNELIQLLKESDHSSYNEIYERYFYLVFVNAYKKLRDEEQAKDVVQDVFVSLWFKRATGISEGNLAGYLLTAVRNKIFDLFAHEQVKLKYADSVIAFFKSAQSVSTDHLIRERELALFIEKQIQALPPKMRRVFELSKKDYLSNPEIADLLGTTENNVAQHVSSALRLLKTRLGIFVFLCTVLNLMA